MKTMTHDQSRFTCRLARGCLAVFGDTTAGTPHGPGAAHVAACADCQRFFAACDELDLALTRDATSQWHEAPSNLEQNILRAVNQSIPHTQPRGQRGAWLSLAGVAACAVVTTLVYRQQTQPGVSPTPVRTQTAVATTVAPTVADPAMLVAARQIMDAVPTDLFVQMQPQAEAILQQDPMKNEVDAMKSDARRAVQFLALNFLPTPANDQASGE